MTVSYYCVFLPLSTQHWLPNRPRAQDGGDGDCEDDGGWEKHPAKKGKTLDCDWVAKSPKKRCKKKNKGGTKASKACACACA